LRDLVASAASGETIDFGPVLDGATITLTSGEIEIDGLQLTIGASALPAGITVSGNDASRVFNIFGNADVTMENLAITNGYSAGSGGAIFVNQSDVSMADCVVRSSESDALGGGIYLGSSTDSTFTRCEISQNRATAFGGGIYCGQSSPVLTNCSIVANASDNDLGGGIYNIVSSPVLVNCTVHGNFGGGIRNEPGSPELRNTIAWGNRFNPGGPGASNPLANQQITNVSTSNPDVAHCLIEGANSAADFGDGELTVWGAGNLDGTNAANAPPFTTPVAPVNPPAGAGDVRLSAACPALDAGNNSDNTETTDLDGNPRIQNGTIDLGAFEILASFAQFHPGLDPDDDANLNGLSNYLDYALGGDPLASPAAIQAPVVIQSGGLITIEHSRRTAASDVFVSYRKSTDLDIWNPLEPGVDFTLNSAQLDPTRVLDTLELTATPSLIPKFFVQPLFSPTGP